MLKKRVITALWGIPVLVVAIWFDTPLPWFTILVAVWGGLAVLEFYRLVATSKVPPLTYFGLIWTLLFILSRDPALLTLIGPFFDQNRLTPLLLASAVILPLIWLLRREQKEKAFISWAWTTAGILYVGWLLSYLVALKGLNDGRNWILLVMFTTFASDTAAFFIGRTWGRHQLAPNISPKKTWEGAIAGAIGAIIVSLLFLLPTPLNLPMNWAQAILLGLIASVFGQLGDMVESLFKRNMGAKDSGNLLPGHGGVLDRIDSIVFTGVVVYYYVLWIIQ
ncbi:MAG: phosphatidate cytidylyltransferase [Chloroflexi bacterium]|nr:phosphatidate cytidylyltransferase [Chloroflexota bacterium]